jgi:catechol 2,3-dioxygenase-like lactoylglutathione lyase family enzyme
MKRLTTLLITALLALPSIAGAPPDRPKIYSVAFVRFRTSDIEQSKVFYGNTLGLKSGFDDCKGVSIPCYSVNPYQHVELALSNSTNSGSLLETVAFNVSDVEQMHRFLSSRGLNPSPVTRGPNSLRFFQVTDPEGNHVAFVELSGADSQIDGPHQVSNRLIHTGFIVHERAATEHFYEDVLGFRPYWHGGMKDTQDDWVSLQVPDGTDWVEFMVSVSADADQRLRGIMNHIALGVGNIHIAREKLLKNGWKPTEEPKIGRDGKWQLNLYDPDDTRVEFMEFTPKEKPCCSEFTGPHPKP